jgi:hypothetical protein
MSNNISNLIRQEMAKLEKQYKGLGEALKVIDEISGGKSSGIKLSSLSGLIDSGGEKRGPGRPPGKKRGPKPKAKIAQVAKVAKAPKPVGRPGKKGAKPGKRPKRGIKLNSAIRDYIKSAGRFVSSPELSNKFSAHYPEKSKADFTKYVSVLLSISKKNKELNSTNFDKSGKEQRAAFWGMPEWFSNGKAKNEFYK